MRACQANASLRELNLADCHLGENREKQAGGAWGWRLDCETSAIARLAEALTVLPLCNSAETLPRCRQGNTRLRALDVRSNRADAGHALRLAKAAMVACSSVEEIRAFVVLVAVPSRCYRPCRCCSST